MEEKTTILKCFMLPADNHYSKFTLCALKTLKNGFGLVDNTMIFNI